jgi:hypothetical protein
MKIEYLWMSLQAWDFALRAMTPQVAFGLGLRPLDFAFSYDPTGRATTPQDDPTSRAVFTEMTKSPPFNSPASTSNSLSIYNSYIAMSKFFITSAVRQSLINIETLCNSVGGQWLRLLRSLSMLSFCLIFL